MSIDSKIIGRFAPSSTGEAHPGTLMAALLAWLDARHRKGRFYLRHEDLDTQRCKVEWVDQMRRALVWLGIDWDVEQRQSEHIDNYENVMDRLASQGRIYSCRCSRAEIKKRSHRAPDGGFAYDNQCRTMALTASAWRDHPMPIRLNLGDAPVSIRDENGLDLSQNPALVMGDPVIRRRDGAFAYQLAAVVDDARTGITHIVRGQDIAVSIAQQVRLLQFIKAPIPCYRHHFLLLETHEQKQAKLHGSLPWSHLQTQMGAEECVGRLACLSGLRSDASPIKATELLETFDWTRIRPDNVLWT